MSHVDGQDRRGSYGKKRKFQAMTTVYHTHPATLCTVEDILDYMKPHIRRYVNHHYNDLSWLLRDELVQAALIAIYDEFRDGELKVTDAPRFWMQTGKHGIRDCFQNIERETGVFINVSGKHVLQQREYSESTFVKDDPDELENNDIIDVLVYHSRKSNKGGSDPEGGAADARIDFEWLFAKAVALIPDNERADCLELIRSLAFDDEHVGIDFRTLRGWSEGRYYKTMDRLKDVFYTAAGKERPPKERGARNFDPEQVIQLWSRGYGAFRIARQVGCSSSRADQIIQAARQQGRLPVRSMERAYTHGRIVPANQVHLYA
jgi:hypothetical protein